MVKAYLVRRVMEATTLDAPAGTAGAFPSRVGSCQRRRRLVLTSRIGARTAELYPVVVAARVT